MSEPPDRDTVIWLAVAIEGGLLAAAELLGWLFSQPPLTLVQWNLEGVLWGVAATVPMVLAFLAMLRWPVGPIGRIKRITEELLVPLLIPCTVTDLLGISVLAGLGEELMFRGVLLDLLRGWFGIWAAVVLTSALFGAMHALTLTYALFAAGMGAFMAGLWLWTGNLLVPIVAHALYDFLALLYLLRGPGAPEVEYEEPAKEEEEEPLL
jgi:membrane protease YdiL (CAAX protease family)